MKRSDPGTVFAFQSFLLRHSLLFACAESCTGGLLSRQMTARAGSSRVFWGGVVTYSNEAKTRLLQVPSELIGAHGAVSGPVAAAMVRGLVLHSRVPLAVSVTGVAGPGGGTPDKPVGTVWFGLSATRKETVITAVEVRFSGSRARIQSAAALFARTLAQRWWESGMDLDSLRSVPDNEGKSRVAAFQPPFPLLFDPL